ncbi:Bifunctional purine biosynthesis protein PurH [Linderina macrospora]|uniref:Bifunctional purine biosynthesis protein PurH n=1 Tax=Linderina macrospora TaxID=4868 RepID=A0ACC1JHZ7_9FUNG|nr:Bifunctional purine biosynthesis protein PurH [Linderina macrospora]
MVAPQSSTSSTSSAKTSGSARSTSKSKCTDKTLPRVFAVALHDVDNNKYQDSRNAGISWYVFFSVLLASLSAVNIGWTCGVLNIGKSSICDFEGTDAGGSDFPERILFTTNTWMLAIGVMAVGGFLGALLSGWISDNMGRRNTLVINNCLFMAGSVLLGTATTSVHFILGRFVSGVGCGIASAVVCMYVGEIAPIRRRGFFGAFFQLAVVLGIMGAQVASMFLTGHPEWRILVAIPGAISLIQVMFLPFRVESPVYLIKTHQVNEARHALLKLRRGYDVSAEWQDCIDALDEARETIPTAIRQPTKNSSKHADGCEVNESEATIKDAHTGGCKDTQVHKASLWRTVRGMTKDDLRHLFIACVSLMALQQLSGINGIIFYSNSIFLGLFDNAQPIIARWACVGVTASAVPAVLLCMVCFTGMVVASVLIFVGMFFGKGLIVVVMLYIYYFLFNLGVGTIPWLYLAELVPGYALGGVMAMACAVNWLFSFAVGFVFPMVQWYLAQYQFLLFAGFSLIGVVFVMLFAPESGNKSVMEVVAKHRGPMHIVTRRRDSGARMF